MVMVVVVPVVVGLAVVMGSNSSNCMFGGDICGVGSASGDFF